MHPPLSPSTVAQTNPYRIHQDRQLRVFVLFRAVGRHAHHGVIDLGRDVAHDPRPPDLQRPQITIAGDAQDG
jgi:hypothetical protein